MPSLLEALSDGSFDTTGLKAASGDFTHKLDVYKRTIVDEYLKYNIDLNKSIAKIAKKDNLNDDQIQRIVEEVNNQVYLILYNRMHNSSDRNVEFDLASAKKIKDEISGKTSPAVEEETKAANFNYGRTMEKTASWGNAGDKPNMFNHVSYDFTGIGPDARRSKENIELEKTAYELQKVNTDIQKYTEKAASSAYIVADALIQYSRHGLDAQNIYEEICKTAQCNIVDQKMIQGAVQQKIAQLQECRKLPKEYSVKLNMVNTQKEASEFSLQQYSFMKEAAFSTASNQNVPIVVTDETTIRSLNDLVKQINNISENTKSAKSSMKQKDDLVKAAGFTPEQAEKIAAAGHGIVAFGQALTGAGVRGAKKNLDEATSTLSKKVSDPRFLEAKDNLSILTKSKKNVDIHPRMKEVNDTLQNAFSNYDAVARKADAKINENAIKHPITHNIMPSTIGAKLERIGGKMKLDNVHNVANVQAKRIKHDLNDQVSNAERSVKNISNELDINGAAKVVQDAEKAYNKAISSRKKARGVALVGVGAGVAANEARKRNQDQNSAMYY